MLDNKIPPPLVMVLFGLAMWGVSLLLPVVEIPARLPLALIIAVVAFVVAIGGVLSFRKAQTTVNPLNPEQASSLVTSGIFQYTRNPMYLGMALLLTALVVLLASPWLLVDVLLFIAYITRFQIQPEERAMQKLFGEEFDAYCQAVRRWL